MWARRVVQTSTFRCRLNLQAMQVLARVFSRTIRSSTLRLCRHHRRHRVRTIEMDHAKEMVSRHSVCCYRVPDRLLGAPDDVHSWGRLVAPEHVRSSDLAAGRWYPYTFPPGEEEMVSAACGGHPLGHLGCLPP